MQRLNGQLSILFFRKSADSLDTSRQSRQEVRNLAIKLFGVSKCSELQLKGSIKQPRQTN